uniref:Mpv17-like protein n=4 Tax=Parascaris univalens TaxID=6257 RepID=A0A915ASS2_PARUN
MTDSVWNHRQGGQRFGVPPVAYGRPFGQRPLPVHSSSEYSQSRLSTRRAQLDEPFGRLRSRSSQALTNLETAVGPEEATVNEKALVLDVHRAYGRILSPTNLHRPNVHIFFSLDTLSGSEPLSSITNDLCEIFEVGDQVEIGIEGRFSANSTVDEYHAILTCTTILQIRDGSERPELAPLLMVQEGGEMPLAVTKNCGLVGVHPQVLPIPAVISAFLESASSISVPPMSWPEFAMVGHSVEGRLIRAPRWMNGNGTQELEKVALTLQRYGRDIAGFAIIKGHLENGVVLMPIDKDDLKVCGEIFYPFEMKRAESAGFDYRKVYSKGSKWYFRACRELPGRRFKFRAYSLDDLSGAMQRNSAIPFNGMMDGDGNRNAHDSEGCDETSGRQIGDAVRNPTELRGCPAVAERNVDVHTLTAAHDEDARGSSPLVDIGAQTVDHRSEVSAQKCAVISDSTLRQLAEVDFSTPTNLLDIEEPVALSQPVIPLEPCRAPVLRRPSLLQLSNLMSANVDHRDSDSVIVPKSASTAVSDSCLSSARSRTVSLESESHLCPSSFASAAQADNAHSDGETLLLNSTPPPTNMYSTPSSINVVTRETGNNVVQLEDDAPLHEHSNLTDHVSDEMILSSSSLVVRKYNVFDVDLDTSIMHLEILNPHKRTYEEELIGCLDDEVSQNRTLAQVSPSASFGASTTTYAQSEKQGDNVLTRQQPKSNLSVEMDNGGVQFVGRGENLADVLLRLETDERASRLMNSHEEGSGAESSDEEDDGRNLHGPFPIRVQRRPDDNEFWFTAKDVRQSFDTATNSHSQHSLAPIGDCKKQCTSFGKEQVDSRADEGDKNNSVAGMVKTEKAVQCDATNEASLSSLSAVLQSDDVIAKFFTDIVKREPR